MRHKIGIIGASVFFGAMIAALAYVIGAVTVITYDKHPILAAAMIIWVIAGAATVWGLCGGDDLHD